MKFLQNVAHFRCNLLTSIIGDFYNNASYHNATVELLKVFTQAKQIEVSHDWHE